MTAADLPPDVPPSWGACRYCAWIAWTLGPSGRPEHACCVLAARERPGERCPHCVTSASLNRRQEGRTGR